jgi:hypothetical protein
MSSIDPIDRELLEYGFFIHLSVSAQEILLRRYNNDYTAFRSLPLVDDKIADLYVLTRDFLVWCALVFRTQKLMEPLDNINELAKFIETNSDLHANINNLRFSLARSLSPRTISDLIRETKLASEDILKIRRRCHNCCIYHEPPHCERYGGINDDECFTNCVVEHLTRYGTRYS